MRLRASCYNLFLRVGDPDVAGLDQTAAAEVLLRAGALTGWLGNNAEVGGRKKLRRTLLAKASRCSSKPDLRKGRTRRASNWLTAISGKAGLTKLASSCKKL